MSGVGEHLRGPWQAFLTAEDGSRVFTSITDIPANVEVAVAVLRGDALTAARGGQILDESKLDDLDVLYVVTPDHAKDWSSELPVRWLQAQAVAEALNARAGVSSSEPGA
jgi:hypothetical protein